MPEPTGVRWHAPPHTLAKHQILESYVGAWFSILGQSPLETRLLFVDGFSGPGEYEQEDGSVYDGSPIIALKVARSVLAKDLKKMKGKKFIFLFVDSDPDRIDYLEKVAIPKLGELPEAMEVHCVEGTFDKTMTSILDDIRPDHHLIPAFVMIDPFGWSGLPMELIERILENPKSEVLITFMVEAVNRWLKTEKVASSFEDLFGCDAEEARNLLNAPNRFDALSDFYEEKLREHARYVRSFRMIGQRNRPIYDLVFGTGHWKGLRAMKRAMWGVDPVAGGVFSDRTAGQTTLFGDDPDTGPLRAQLIDEFEGQVVTPEHIIRFVVEETAFHDGHVKRRTLSPMEADGLIEYIPPPRAEKKRRSRGQYPPRSRVKFLS